jgi:hypothetical protein
MPQKKSFHLLGDVAALGLAYQHEGGINTQAFRPARAESRLAGVDALVTDNRES